ncbi:MAG: EAL domain-containing protein [Gammaproteobacteria bacterium]|nr:EAL domain-containing protein [Gammaproteobacteria bacterium]
MSRTLRINLQTRYSLQIMAIIFAGMISLSAFSVWHFSSAAHEYESVTMSAIESHLEEQLRERAEVMTEYLAQDLSNALLVYDLQAMLRQLGTATAQSDVLFAYVYGADGLIVHDGSPEITEFGRPLDELLGWEASILREPRAVLSGKDLEFVRPINLGAEALGGVAVGLSLKVVAAETAGLSSELRQLSGQSLRKEISYAATFTLLFVLAGALLALVTARRLAGPIRRLAGHARQVGRGQFGQQVDIRRNDEVGDLVSAFGNMQQSLEANQKEIAYLAYHDPLTGLQNRASMITALNELCADCRQKETMGAVLFIDLDDFKPVNDTLGHEAGDAVLRSTAKRLLACLESDLASGCIIGGEGLKSAARLGGDEFTVMLTNLGDEMRAASICDEILKELSRPFEVNGREIFIGASIGVSVFPQDGRDAESLLARADVAMYHAKRHGKHAHKFFEEHMLEETRAKLFLINDLRSALSSEGLTMHYQPIVAAASGRVIGAEALVRWQHPRRGLIKAAEFIEVAEKSGEIERLGQWALDKVCADLAGWRESGLDGLFVSINISSQQLMRADLHDYVTGALSRWGLGSRDLRIEASEDRFAKNAEGATSVLREWNAAGFEIWIDNFGSGAGSLTSLLGVPARGIKLDPSFIKGITTNERLRTFVSSIIKMAHSLQLEVCAVGVTSAALADWLKENGCRYLQGQFLGPELNAENFIGHLRFKPGGGNDENPRSLKAI